jgi:hypothetical protein
MPEYSNSAESQSEPLLSSTTPTARQAPRSVTDPDIQRRDAVRIDWSPNSAGGAHGRDPGSCHLQNSVAGHSPGGHRRGVGLRRVRKAQACQGRSAKLHPPSCWQNKVVLRFRAPTAHLQASLSPFNGDVALCGRHTCLHARHHRLARHHPQITKGEQHLQLRPVLGQPSAAKIER